MEKNELLTLVTVTGMRCDENGFKTEELTVQKEIFCAVKSVGRTEHYEAARSGFKAGLIFVVNRDDFETAIVDMDGRRIKPTKVLYNGVTYLIHRNYVIQYGDMELTCEEVE